jgi:hypothetical protein
MRLIFPIAIFLGLLSSDIHAQSVRIASALLTSGNSMNYDDGEGIRVLKGIDADVVLIQQFVYTANTYSNFATSTLGSGTQFFRGTGSIPTGILSRYPIVQSGEWTDPTLSNRTFSWAKIDIPGDKFLWAVSVHFSTVETSRNLEASELVSKIHANIPTSDYLVVGGDFNCETHTEALFSTLAAEVTIPANFPVDQANDPSTNAPRTKPYDNILFDADLQGLETPTVVGTNSFPSGLVLDTRTYTPLADFAPAQVADSAAHTHLAVLRDFDLAATPIRITAASFSMKPSPLGQVTFTSQPGLTYGVQASFTLSAGSWQEIGSITASAGPSTTFQVVPSSPASGQLVDPQLGTAPKRFYRLYR